MALGLKINNIYHSVKLHAQGKYFLFQNHVKTLGTRAIIRDEQKREVDEFFLHPSLTVPLMYIEARII